MQDDITSIPSILIPTLHDLWLLSLNSEPLEVAAVRDTAKFLGRVCRFLRCILHAHSLSFVLDGFKRQRRTLCHLTAFAVDADGTELHRARLQEVLNPSDRPIAVSTTCTTRTFFAGRRRFYFVTHKARA